MRPTKTGITNLSTNASALVDLCITQHSCACVGSKIVVRRCIAVYASSNVFICTKSSSRGGTQESLSGNQMIDD